MEDLEGPLELGGHVTAECPALARSVEVLRRQLCDTHDLCLLQLGSDDGTASLKEFRKQDGAFLSPISILAYLLSEERVRLARDSDRCWRSKTRLARRHPG